MCTKVVIDNDVANSKGFLSEVAGSSGNIFRKWLENGNGLVTYSTASADCQAIQDNQEYLSIFIRYRREGRIHTVTPKEYAAAKKELSGKPLQSNDLDLLSVALAGDATVLYSSDLPFQQDFTDPAVLPKAGGITRAVYPHERGTPKARRDFLALRKCPARL